MGAWVGDNGMTCLCVGGCDYVYGQDGRGCVPSWNCCFARRALPWGEGGGCTHNSPLNRLQYRCTKMTFNVLSFSTFRLTYNAHSVLQMHCLHSKNYMSCQVNFFNVTDFLKHFSCHLTANNFATNPLLTQ